MNEHQHPALKNLYEEVVNGKFLWDRWGLLSVLSDYVLNYTSGSIVEIGCGESSIHLSKLAEKYNRTCYHCEYSKSGVENMKNTKGYFGKNSIVYTGKSDDFFKDTNLPPIALGFIDGDHTYEQVKKDFNNLWNHVIKDGHIFLHDTYPPNESWHVPEKCGTVYKLREQLETCANEPLSYFDGENVQKYGSYDVFTFTHSAFNVGLTMVKKNDSGLSGLTKIKMG